MEALEMSLGMFLASADIDENRSVYKHDSSDRRFNLVGTIGSIVKGGVKVEVYGAEHYPRHFHVKTNDAEINATFNLLTCEHGAGQLPKKYEKPVKTWHQLNKKALIDAWNKCNPNMKTEH